MVEARSGRVLRTIDVDLNPWDIAVDQRADRTFMSTVVNAPRSEQI
jgi:hypothetical protein